MKDEERDLKVVIHPSPFTLHPSSFLLHPCFWWSELESNQPFGFFRPALIRLSYPTTGCTLCFVLCTLISIRAFRYGLKLKVQSSKHGFRCAAFVRRAPCP